MASRYKLAGKYHEHIVIAERALGRKLPKGSVVHHANGDRTDNRPENLVICPSAAYHSLLHQRMRAIAACGKAHWRACGYCHEYDDPANLYINGRQARHRACFNAAWTKRQNERRKEVPHMPPQNQAQLGRE